MTVKAIYENGVFKPTEPVDLREHTEVEVLVPAEVPALPAQDGVQAGKHQFQLHSRELSHVFIEHVFVERDHLRCIGYRILWQVRDAGSEKDVSWCIRPLHVRRQWDANDRGDSTAVERITLNDYDRSAIAGA